MSAGTAPTARALMIAAPSSGAGKTTVTLGLLRALRNRGVAVAGAKSGPDYIDPRFHEAAAGRPSVNLDAWAMDRETLRALAAATPADLLLVEAAMGLLDGAPEPGRTSGLGSAADLAAALGTPVVMVLDVAGTAQSAAAWLTGAARLRPELAIAGAILNRVGSPRHAAMTRQAVEAAGFAVFGAVPREASLTLPSRHLGLVQAAEHSDMEGFIVGAARILADSVDLDRIVAAATGLTGPQAPAATLPPLGVRIAVARDEAFAFVYPHVLAAWQRAGARIDFFSPLADQGPSPGADAVYLPGGYPELHAARLAAAGQFRRTMQEAAAAGVRIYGECGGYMALGRTLVDADGASHPMLGLLPLDTSFAARRLTLGYRRLVPREGAPWSGPLAAHEFHYAVALAEGPSAPLFDATDAEGTRVGPIGLVEGSVSGSFAHVIGPAPG